MLNQVCMRSVAAALMAAVSVLALAGCGDEQQPPAAQNTPTNAMPFTIQTEPLTAGAGEHLLVLNVEGMTCDGCADAINSTVAKLPGVKNVSSNPQQLKAWVVVADGSTTDPAAVASQINALADGKLYKATPAGN